MRLHHRLAACALAILGLTAAASPAALADDDRRDRGDRRDRATVRYATFNASLNRYREGQLVEELADPSLRPAGDAQIRTVAEIIQRVRPDVLLVNEFDYDDRGRRGSSLAARLFQDNYLSESQNGARPIRYPYRFTAASNTGIPSGFDLDNNGQVVSTPGTPGYGNDAFGFGDFPGQFGMTMYSRYPIQKRGVRTFQEFLWKDMPGARLPDNPDTPAPRDWYSPEELAVFRLSSKSHWDIPIRVRGKTVHFLTSHPTPPVFDGREDRNGTRNADEIRLWADYITPGAGGYIYDDRGRRGGLEKGARFVIAGDQNSDPLDGDSIPGAIQQLLDNPRVNTSVTPSSPGGPEQAALQGGANTSHRSDPAHDTADFADSAPGNLRADYVLPDRSQEIEDAFVFWPRSDDPLFPLVGTFSFSRLPDGNGFPSSDHRLVAVDVEPGRAHGGGDDDDDDD
jgi:3-phytase